MAIDFSKNYKPLFVPVSENETLEQFRERWAKVDALSEKEKDILSSDFTYNSIFELSKNIGLSEIEVAEISRLVRAVVCGDVRHGREEDFLTKKIIRLKAEDIPRVKEAIDKIFSQKIQKGEEIGGTEKNTLQLAMSKYKKIGDQLVTSAPIKLRVFPEPVRPSIKNWINDYYDHLGAGKHGTIERGNFLFHSENGKRLSTLDRKRLAEVLKSLDEEESTISIDVQNEKIIFENVSQFHSDEIRLPQAVPSRPISSAENVFRQEEPKKMEGFLSNTDAVAKPLAGGNENKIIAFKKKEADETREKEVLNRSFGNFHVSLGDSGKKDFQVNAISGKEPRITQMTSWNPAEAVRKRMEEEKRSSLFAKNKGTSEDRRSNDARPSGKIVFSSPQVLPVEKEKGSQDMSFGKDFFQNKDSQKQVHYDDNVKTEELIERIRLNNMKALQNQKSKAIFRITPLGSHEKKDKVSSGGEDDLAQKNNRNVVDLR